VDDEQFQADWERIKLDNKKNLVASIAKATGVKVNPESLFDIQVKRIHEYKRQHLNVLHILTLYNRLKRDHDADIVPRTFIFGGKAAPGYFMAKLMIKLINAVAYVINNDPVIRGRLKVVFYPNFNVTNAQKIYPAADISEQISTAGKEASGTSNMKFAMNGAVTIGTYDGANIEIRHAVGEENFFLFGMNAGQVAETWVKGYNPRDYYNNLPELKSIFDLIASGVFSHGDPAVFKPLLDNLLTQDPYRVLGDYHSYIDCQEHVSQAWRDRKRWVRMSILNVARIGKFSSDRSIRDYCMYIWQISPTTSIVHKF
jgi:starch phosphorylase